MKSKHIAWILESSHGHINPTLGIASQLVARGYDVSYAVKESFAPKVESTGAKAVVYRPLQNKLKVFREMRESKEGDYSFDFKSSRVSLLRKVLDEEAHDSCEQLKNLYGEHRPDIIIYEQMNMAGKLLASEWSIRTIGTSPICISNETPLHEEEMVIVTLPRFFQSNADELNSRFHFVGPVLTDGKAFRPWHFGSEEKPIILVSATTGLLPSVEYFRTAIDAFRDCSWQVVLSIGDEMEPASLGPMPGNFEINQYSSQLEILQKACLFIGHGGVTSVVEAIRSGVPAILCPPSQVHEFYARRVAELGLAVCIRESEFSAEELRRSAVAVLEDQSILRRVKEFQRNIQESRGAEKAADLIEHFIRGVPNVAWQGI